MGGLVPSIDPALRGRKAESIAGANSAGPPLFQRSRAIGLLDGRDYCYAELLDVTLMSYSLY